MFTDDKITVIFVMCDEFSQKFDEFFKKTSLEAPKSGKRKYYRAPRMCDSEVMTILILFHKSGYRCLKHYYLNHICTDAEMPSAANAPWAGSSGSSCMWCATKWAR